MSNKTVYLAGLISTEKFETFLWRQDAEVALIDHFHVLNPLRDKHDLSCQSQDGGITDPRLTSRDIILRDYQDVMSSDVILANLETYGSTRPSVGTMIELGWAWQSKIPVVAIASPENYLMRQHPFVKECMSRYEETLEDACKFLRHYYA